MEKVKIPSGEIVWVGYFNREGNPVHIITSKESREWYYLYENAGGEWRKVGREKDPESLVRKHKVREKMGCS